MSVNDFNWKAAEADVAVVETIEPVTNGKAEATASAVTVDDAAAHASWDAPKATELRPILPQWAASRSAAADAAVRLGKLMVYRCGYHGLRLPLYGARLLAWSPVGVARMVGGVWQWASDAEGRQVRSDAVHGGDWQAYAGLVRLRDRHVRFRGFVCALGLATAATGGTLLVLAAPGAAIATGAGLLAVAGAVGRPTDKPLVTRAVVKHELRPLTAPMVEQALSSIGIAALAGKRPVNWPSPIHRDGPGWRAEIDLPAGVTALEVAERRDKLASGLSRPLGCVWPEGVPEAHPGRLVLWVGDRDLADARDVAWPLERRGVVDLFEPFPVGVDPRGNAVSMEAMYSNLLIGSIPGYGKTFLAKIPLLAAGLDARSESWVFELKGTGDLAFSGQYATKYASGFDDASIEAAFDALGEAVKECQRRAAVIKGLPRDLCPENKVTSQLADRKDLGLHPLVLAIDECQNLFTHEEFGKAAGERAEKVIKLGRALGIYLLLATQRPDNKSMPTGVSANVGTRACLRVMGHIENDMILGTSAHKNGIRATMFTRRDKGVFYLVGATDEPVIVKGAKIDAPQADAIAARCRALRIARGNLTGHAAGDTAEAAPKFNVLDDLAAVWPLDQASVQNHALVALLVKFRPEFYAHLAELDDGERTAALTALAKPYGLNAKDVSGRDGHRKTTRRGFARADLDEARKRR
jgi:S-DNA-T family DNA segregation ATPase FtsK/SpoIIIE